MSTNPENQEWNSGRINRIQSFYDNQEQARRIQRSFSATTRECYALMNCKNNLNEKTQRIFVAASEDHVLPVLEEWMEKLGKSIRLALSADGEMYAHSAPKKTVQVEYILEKYADVVGKFKRSSLYCLDESERDQITVNPSGLMIANSQNIEGFVDVIEAHRFARASDRLHLLNSLQGGNYTPDLAKRFIELTRELGLEKIEG